MKLEKAQAKMRQLDLILARKTKEYRQRKKKELNQKGKLKSELEEINILAEAHDFSKFENSSILNLSEIHKAEEESENQKSTTFLTDLTKKPLSAKYTKKGHQDASKKSRQNTGSKGKRQKNKPQSALGHSKPSISECSILNVSQQSFKSTQNGGSGFTSKNFIKNNIQNTSSNQSFTNPQQARLDSIMKMDVHSQQNKSPFAVESLLAINPPDSVNSNLNVKADAIKEKENDNEEALVEYEQFTDRDSSMRIQEINQKLKGFVAQEKWDECSVSNDLSIMDSTLSGRSVFSTFSNRSTFTSANISRIGTVRGKKGKRAPKEGVLKQQYEERVNKKRLKEIDQALYQMNFETTSPQKSITDRSVLPLCDEDQREVK